MYRNQNLQWRHQQCLPCRSDLPDWLNVQTAAQPMPIERRQILAGVATTITAAAVWAPSALAESRTALFKQYYDNTDAVHGEMHCCTAHNFIST
jgi:hypothetical protein